MGFPGENRCKMQSWKPTHRVHGHILSLRFEDIQYAVGEYRLNRKEDAKAIWPFRHCAEKWTMVCSLQQHSFRDDDQNESDSPPVANLLCCEIGLADSCMSHPCKGHSTRLTFLSCHRLIEQADWKLLSCIIRSSVVQSRLQTHCCLNSSTLCRAQA